VANRRADRRHSRRDPINGQYVPHPTRAPERPKVPPLVELAFSRHCAAVEQRLRNAYTRRHGVKAADISFSVRLLLKGLARLSSRLEVMTARAAEGAPVDDVALHRLSCEQGRVLRQLGLAEGVIKPPPPPKPVPSLSSVLKQQAMVR
jgi:hypothetical protein